ncbi:MAG TPA: LysR family transcriptional regulator [Burkholderiaceae bacterium]|nr:LysR family transcriptional regulator [Burkholderiaceae bacterium]
MSSQISLKQVNCFLAVAEELNFRRAAERLFMTQPPLSRHISTLEQQLGKPLFLRDRRSVALTEFGQALIPRARALVRAHAELAHDLPAAPPLPQVLRVGVTTALEPDFFTSIGPLFERHHPGCHVEFKRQISLRSVRDIARGTLDLALVGLPSDSEGLPCRRLSDDPLGVAMSTLHPCASQRVVALADLRNSKLFWFARKLNPAYHDHFEQVFDRHDFHPARLPEPPEHHVLLSLVAADRGIALIPRSLRAIQRKNVVYKQLRESRQFKVGAGVVWSTPHPTGLLAAFLEMLVAHGQDFAQKN